ncbi:MAG TPA: DUF4337 family protein [Puia sp.]|jgi:hypothetical protein
MEEIEVPTEHLHETIEERVEETIAISAIAILTRKKILWFAGLCISCVGLFFFISGLF